MEELDNLERINNKNEETINLLRHENMELKKTIDNLVDNHMIIRRLNCTLFDQILQNLNKLDNKIILENLINENYDIIIKSILFSDESVYPIVKHGRNYLYKNMFNNISVLQYTELSEIVYVNLERVLNSYIKLNIKKYDENTIRVIENNKRALFKQKDHILKNILKNNT